MNSIKQKVFKDIENSSTIKLIGIGVLGNAEYNQFLEDCLFSDTNEGKKELVVVAESDNQLFQQSLLTDVQGENRKSFEQLRVYRDFFTNRISKNKARLKKLDLNISALTLPFNAIITDDSLWYLPLNRFSADNYIRISETNPLYNSVLDWVDFLENTGKRFLDSSDVEMLELFDQNKVPRGIFPRGSFYNTDHYQFVVWGLVFNRKGKLLIHKRKENAKDNQNMWDKSIGGHIDFKNEKSSQEAVVRELIEELYTEEKKEQEGKKNIMLSEDISKAYFLGDWRPEGIGPQYLDHIKLIEERKDVKEENWVFYKLPISFTHNTPRILPGEQGERWLRVMVDVFVFITDTTINEKSVKKFKNSQYLLIEPNKLKTWMENGINDENVEFKFTPDLKYIMTGNLRDIIDEVSSTIKFSNIRK